MISVIETKSMLHVLKELKLVRILKIKNHEYEIDLDHRKRGY